MKKLFFMLGLCLLAAGAGSCTDDTEKDNARIAELEEQIAALKAQLENNAKITNVAFADGQMTLTFGDGTVLTTDTPDNIVPTIGENGNWWVNGEDLGVSAEAQIPTVGSNGNWWVGGEDTGVSAKGDKGDQGDKGDKGDKGDTGTGIQSTSYDPETGILTITLTDGTKYEYALSTDGEELIGNRLEDLNGAYLLASILNGDLPFAQLTYDDQNRMTSIAYYETLLNAPVKSADVKFTYNADGKIATRTATYYAKQNQVTDIESTAIYNPSSGYGIPGWLYNEAQTLSATQIFDKLFPNDDIYDQIGGSHEFAGRIRRAPRPDARHHGGVRLGRSDRLVVAARRGGLRALPHRAGDGGQRRQTRRGASHRHRPLGHGPRIPPHRPRRRTRDGPGARRPRHRHPHRRRPRPQHRRNAPDRLRHVGHHGRSPHTALIPKDKSTK